MRSPLSSLISLALPLQIAAWAHQVAECEIRDCFLQFATKTVHRSSLIDDSQGEGVSNMHATTARNDLESSVVDPDPDPHM